MSKLILVILYLFTEANPLSRNYPASVGRTDNSLRASIANQLVLYNNKLEEVELMAEELNTYLHEIMNYKKSRKRSRRQSSTPVANIPLVKLSARPSCHAWFQAGYKDSGAYLIDADGIGAGEPPVQVHCNMLTGGATLIHHNSEKETNVKEEMNNRHCTGRGCYSREIRYEASLKQILALLHISKTCRQKVKIECLNTRFQMDNVPYSWWIDRRRKPQYYWAGKHQDAYTCSCGKTHGCIEHRVMCNCDGTRQNDEWLADVGYISEVNDLPVTELLFGSPNINEAPMINFTLGPLTCFGHKQETYPQSCEDLVVKDINVNGYYAIGDPDNVNIAFCNIEYLPDAEYFQEPILSVTDLHRNTTKEVSEIEEAVETIKQKYQQQEQAITNISMSVDQLELAASPVRFYTYEKNYNINNSEYIKFQRLNLNQSWEYDEDIGIFRATVRGVYYVSFHTEVTNVDSKLHVSVRRNGISQATASIISSVWSTVGADTCMSLEVGDEIGLFVESHRYEASSLNNVQFLGLLKAYY